jgi:hypothetical protein
VKESKESAPLYNTDKRRKRLKKLQMDKRIQDTRCKLFDEMEKGEGKR